MSVGLSEREEGDRIIVVRGLRRAASRPPGGELFRPDAALFLARAAAIYPDKIAIVDGAVRYGYGKFYDRCRQFADALRRRGIGAGDTVAVLAPNLAALLEAH
jgi:non-ribosomal peptide synthetase component F